ncbi:MAG TPA: hypothetical protein VFQ45_13625, partial [Longimicrobium sp.]|nr:hypothetical protein [Longimicrobium sp.]
MQRALLSRAARLLLLPLAVLAAACDREATSPSDGMPSDLAPGIYSLFSVTGSGPGATVDLYLKQVQVPGRLASYQGEISYDAGTMSLKAAELPEGVIGTAREAAPGRIRF